MFVFRDKNYDFLHLFLLSKLFSGRYRYDSVLEEYCRYMPFGLSVAASFLDFLHEPNDLVPAEQLNDEQIIQKVFDRGGQVIDDELRSLVVDIYNLYTKMNLTLEKL